jgi:hypothetical protein
MRRAAYRMLLALHPPAFRREFAGEMLWVFDEAAGDGQASGFCLDVARSLLRQWLRERLLWTFSGAVAGGVAMIMWMSAVAPLARPHRSPTIEMDNLLVIAVGSLIAISLTLITTVALFHSMRRRRM